MRTKGFVIRNKPDGARSKTLQWGLEILFLYNESKPLWGITEISRATGLHKGRVHRAVKTMEEAGFLRRDDRSRKYFLGYRLFQLGTLAARNLGLILEARAQLRDLAKEVEATVYVTVRDGDMNLVIDSVESPGSLRFYSPPGTRVFWNRGASSKLLAAFAPPEEVEDLLRRIGLIPHTDRTINRREPFLAELEKIRKRGYAISEGEGYPGVLGIAAPIVAPDGVVVAALQASLPWIEKSRRDHPGIIRKVKSTAEIISLYLGQEAPHRAGRNARSWGTSAGSPGRIRAARGGAAGN